MNKSAALFHAVQGHVSARLKCETDRGGLRLSRWRRRGCLGMRLMDGFCIFKTTGKRVAALCKLSPHSLCQTGCSFHRLCPLQSYAIIFRLNLGRIHTRPAELSCSLFAPLCLSAQSMQIKEAPASKHRFRSASSEPSVGDGHEINTCSELPRIHRQMSQVLFRLYSLFVLRFGDS